MPQILSNIINFAKSQNIMKYLHENERGFLNFQTNYAPLCVFHECAGSVWNYTLYHSFLHCEEKTTQILGTTSRYLCLECIFSRSLFQPLYKDMTKKLIILELTKLLNQTTNRSAYSFVKSITYFSENK